MCVNVGCSIALVQEPHTTNGGILGLPNAAIIVNDVNLECMLMCASYNGLVFLLRVDALESYIHFLYEVMRLAERTPAIVKCSRRSAQLL